MTATKATSDRFKVSGLLAGRLKEHQVSVPAVQRRAGLPAGFFQQEKIYVTTAELFALWRAIGETSADPAIGLKLGAEPRFERYQPTAIAAVCSRTFRDALQRIARYKQITCPEEIRVRTSGDEASVEFIYLQAEEVQPDVMVDLVLSWILGIGRRGTEGQIAPLRLELTRSAQNRELLESHFGCRVRFKSSRNAVLFRTFRQMRVPNIKIKSHRRQPRFLNKRPQIRRIAHFARRIFHADRYSGVMRVQRQMFQRTERRITFARIGDLPRTTHM